MPRITPSTSVSTRMRLRIGTSFRHCSLAPSSRYSGHFGALFRGLGSFWLIGRFPGLPSSKTRAVGLGAGPRCPIICRLQSANLLHHFFFDCILRSHADAEALARDLGERAVVSFQRRLFACELSPSFANDVNVLRVDL